MSIRICTLAGRMTNVAGPQPGPDIEIIVRLLERNVT